MPHEKHNLTSRELLAQIGLGEDTPRNLLDDESPEDLQGDLSGVLQERYRAYAERHQFAAGDLVTWKHGMKDRRYPLYGQPAVVIEVLATPIFDSEQETGSTYFRQQLDLVLGLIVNDGGARGGMLTFHFDSHRFQPWKQG
jgi:hypothetical protein